MLYMMYIIHDVYMHGMINVRSYAYHSWAELVYHDSGVEITERAVVV